VFASKKAPLTGAMVRRVLGSAQQALCPSLSSPWQKTKQQQQFQMHEDQAGLSSGLPDATREYDESYRGGASLRGGRQASRERRKEGPRRGTMGGGPRACNGAGQRWGMDEESRAQTHPLLRPSSFP